MKGRYNPLYYFSLKLDDVLKTMIHIFFMILMLITPNCFSRDALKYFVEHRKVYNYSFTMLTNMNVSSDVIWVEYEYYFVDTKEVLKNAKNITEVLTVGIFENSNSPFDCEFLYENDSSEEFKGYTFEVLNLLQDNLHFEINYKKLNYSDIEQNITDYLLTNDVDLLVCHPEINYKLQHEVTQLHPTLSSNYVLIYKPSKLHFTKDIFILTFAGTLWLCFLIFLIILAVCLHISTKRYAGIYSYESWTWVDITLWANAAACQQGLSHTPSGFSSRFLFFLGYLIAYLLYTGFAAGITSLLLQQGMSDEITIADVQKMKLKVVTLMDILFLNDAHIFTNNSKFVTDINKLFEYIDQDNTVGIAPKIFVDQYFARKLNDDLVNNHAALVIMATEYSRGFVILKNSTYKQLLNNGHFIRSKIFSEFSVKWILKKNPSALRCPLLCVEYGLLVLQEAGLLTNALQRSLLPLPASIITSNYSSAGIEHVGSAILILVVGSLSSTVFLVAELIIALYRSRCYSNSKTNSAGYFDNHTSF